MSATATTAEDATDAATTVIEQAPPRPTPRTFRCAICGQLTEPGGMCNCIAGAGEDDGEEYLEALASRHDY